MTRLAKLITAALALAPVVLAQKNDPCSAKSTTIESDGDVSKLASCDRVRGDIIVGPDVTSFRLESVEVIDGKLEIKSNEVIRSIDLPLLTVIKKELICRELIILDTFSAPSLNEVGSIDWQTLPALQSITAKITKAQDVSISDTNLLSLDGINLESANRFEINNNKFLRSVNVQLVNITDILSIEFNKPGVEAIFPNLERARNITFRDAGIIELPSLEIVENSISFVNNSIESLSLPNLTEVGESIAWVSNSQLTNISAPVLEDVGGAFQIANNTKLEELDGFPKLKQVGGAIDCAGTFKEAAFPSLQDVRGGFNFQTVNSFDCEPFEEFESEQVVKGDDFVCRSELDEAQTKDGTTGGTSGKDSKGAAGQLTLSLTGLAATVLGAAVMLL